MNECETGDNHCKDPSGDKNVMTCVNTFGGFFCTCSAGLQRVHAEDGTPMCRSMLLISSSHASLYIMCMCVVCVVLCVV